MKDSWLAEVVFLLAAFAVPMMESTSILPGRTASWALTQHASGGGFSWATGWYLGFGLPLFRFLMFRWLWRLSLWGIFCSALKDLISGLFPPILTARRGWGTWKLCMRHSLRWSLQSRRDSPKDISSEAMTFDSLYSSIPIVLLLNAALVIGPLFIFTRKLYIVGPD
jgi:hypothetical protein